MSARRTTSSNGPNHTPQSHAQHAKEGPARLWSYVPPWFIWFAILGVAALGHWLWPASPWFALVAEASILLWVWVAVRMSQNLHEVLRVLACATVVIVGLFIILANILGLNAVLVSLWGGVGFSFNVAWTIRRMLLPEFRTGQRQMSPGAQKLLDALGGAQLGTAKRKAIEGFSEDTQELGPIHVPIEVNRGEQTVGELKHIPETIETLAGMRPGAARLVHSSKDAGKTELVINPVDLLEGEIPWRGPSAYGESISLPVPVGRYIGTDLCKIFMVGDESEGRNLVQWLVMGMTGAAKSHSIRTLIADLSTRTKVTVWAHDHVKGLQTLMPLIEGEALDWVTMTKADGQAMLAAVRQVIQARARWLGIKGHDQWNDECGLNVLIVWIEEAADLAQLKVLLQLVREGRSVGVVLIISLQRASHTTIDTDTRAQLAGNMCFGVESETDAKFGLPTHVIDAGASPERWRANKPGYCYISAPGIPESKQAEEMRWFKSTKVQIIDACKRGSAVRTPLADEVDQVTIKAAGNIYAKRVPTYVFLNPQHPLFAKGIGMDIGAMTSAKPRKDDEEMTDEEFDSQASQAAVTDSMGSNSTGVYSDDSDFDDDDDDSLNTDDAEEKLNAEVDIPPCPAPNMGPANPVELRDMSTEECRERVQQYLRALDADGKAFVTVPDVQRMKPPIKRGREWLRSELKRLAGTIDGEVPDSNGFRLERDDDMDAGVFRIVPPFVTVGRPT